MKGVKVPVIGFSGLLFIIGFIIGVAVNKLLDTAGIEGLGTEIFAGFKWLDLVNIGIPVALLIWFKKYRPLFVGWIVGSIGTTLIDTVTSAME